jgi:hypothetical protein
MAQAQPASTSGRGSRSLGETAGGDSIRLYEYQQMEHVVLTHPNPNTFAASKISATMIVPAADLPTEIVIRSESPRYQPQLRPSAGYNAAVRRRQSQAALNALRAMDQLDPNRDDGAALTYPFFEAIRKALATIQDFDGEGNSREVLRRVRDTIINGGWGKYRQPETRAAVAEVLKSLLQENVSPEQARSAGRRLRAIGLRPVAIDMQGE